MRTLRTSVLAAVLLLLFVVSASARMAFTKLADQGTAIPNGTGPFTGFALPAVPGGRVMFAAAGFRAAASLSACQIARTCVVASGCSARGSLSITFMVLWFVQRCWAERGHSSFTAAHSPSAPSAIQQAGSFRPRRTASALWTTCWSCSAAKA